MTCTISIKRDFKIQSKGQMQRYFYKNVRIENLYFTSKG